MKQFKDFIKTDFGIALIIALSWKIILLTVGYIIDVSNGGAINLLDHTMRWDAGWYVAIIADHYQTNVASAAFYPLLPFLVGLLHTISFGLIEIPVAGQLINTTAVWFALVALIKLGRLLLGKSKKFWLIPLLLTAPAAFFLHVFYGEALFLALASWAYLFALKRNWLGVGILLAILTAGRLPSLLIIGLCGLEYLRSYDWNIKKSLNKNAFYFLLAPLGFLTYALYLLIVQHNALAMFSAYKATSDWGYQVFDPNIIETIVTSGWQVAKGALGIRPLEQDLFVNNFFPFISILLLGLASLYLIFKAKGKYIPLGIVGLISIIMFTLNNNVVSVHRYILPSLGMYVAIVLITKGKLGTAILITFCVLGTIGQFYLYSLFINALFAG